jgi:hypothetical protein
MITIIEGIPELIRGESYIILIVSNPEWQEGTKQFTYKMNDNGTLTLIKTE